MPIEHLRLYISLLDWATIPMLSSQRQSYALLEICRKDIERSRLFPKSIVGARPANFASVHRRDIYVERNSSERARRSHRVQVLRFSVSGSSSSPPLSIPISLSPLPCCSYRSTAVHVSPLVKAAFIGPERRSSGYEYLILGHRDLTRLDCHPPHTRPVYPMRPISSDPGNRLI